MKRISAIRPRPDEPRPLCYTCWRGGGTCYCESIRAFEAGFSLILLAHPREARNRVGTLRIAHLSVENSVLVVGTGSAIDQEPRLLPYFDDERYFPAVLYPAIDAIQIVPGSDRAQRICEGKRLVVFAIDGTWAQASRMVRSSRLLSRLPKISFPPDRPSQYEFRRQPHEHCLSTVEAVHALIDRLDAADICPAPVNRAHDQMLSVFRDLVRLQLRCERE